MQIKHYHNFNRGTVTGSLDQNAWDFLRTDGNDDAFSLEKTKDTYEKNAAKALSYKKRAEIICSLLKPGNTRLVSLGVGKAFLEWNMKQLQKEFYICCTDYTENALERLKLLFPACDEFRTFDMKNSDDYESLRSLHTVILYRVSTEFSLKEWERIFHNLHNAGVDQIFFVPTKLASLTDYVVEYARRIKGKLLRKNTVFCGWEYSEETFRRMWNDYYLEKTVIYDDDSAVFDLRLRGSGQS